MATSVFKDDEISLSSWREDDFWLTLRKQMLVYAGPVERGRTANLIIGSSFSQAPNKGTLWTRHF